MENNNLIIEELKRVKLLMGYKTDKTLTENESNVRINKIQILSENIGRGLLGGLFGGIDDVARASLIAKNTIPKTVIAQMDDALKNVNKFGDVNVNVKTPNGVYQQTIKNPKSDDVIRSMDDGLLTTAQVTKLKNGFLKSGNVSPELRKVLIDQMSKGKEAMKLASLSKEEITQVLKQNGYNGSIADDIAYKIKDRYGSSGAGGAGAGGAGAGGAGVGGAGAGGAAGKGIGYWRKFKELYGSSKTFKWLVRIGLGYMAYKLFIESDSSAPFPDCIRKKITEEEFIKQNGENSDGSVLISKTGIETIDTVGGGKFYDNKEFKTGNGRYEGTWNDTGSGIVITINGTDYAMSCDNTQDNEDTDDTDDTDDGGNDDEGGVITYRSCSSAPFGLGCINNDIKFVQSCLGIEPVDGKLGPITKSGLKENGYSVPLSQSDLDKIKKECTSSNQDTPEETPVDPLSGRQSLEVETG